MKIYLDACCLSRLTDDQSQARIREETRAIEQMLTQVRESTLYLISSEALEEEVRRNPSLDRRLEAQASLDFAITSVKIDEVAIRRAQVLVRLRYGPFDALHIASAESAAVDVLLSTDDRLIKQAARGLGSPRIRVRNPVSWIEEQKP